MKKIKLQQIGWMIKGTATIHLWGGGKEVIIMDRRMIKGELTKAKLLGAVNDGQFGCECIECAAIEVWEMYEHGHFQYRTTIYADNRYSKQFLQKGISIK